jgi:hypothetical protein
MSEVALKEYFDRRLDDLERRMIERFNLADIGVNKAERTMNERLNSMNEFREALREQANRMATRSEVEKLDDIVQELQRARANLDGRLVVLSGTISLAVSVLLWTFSRFMK